MKDSYLVQRLTKPHKPGDLNPFAFGGGLRNGGLTAEARKMLSAIFDFDYMGAAEFEWGKVPEALQQMARYSAGEFACSFEFEISLSEVEPDFRDKDTAIPEGSGSIYVFCHRDWREEVESRIRAWARGEGFLKEPTNLARTLRPYSEYDGRIVGWLELNNGFFFTTDEEMWKATCNLFTKDTSS